MKTIFAVVTTLLALQSFAQSGYPTNQNIAIPSYIVDASSALLNSQPIYKDCRPEVGTVLSDNSSQDIEFIWVDLYINNDRSYGSYTLNCDGEETLAETKVSFKVEFLMGDGAFAVNSITLIENQ